MGNTRMTSPFWAKLWIEILDDPKVAGMADWLFRRFIFFVLAAKEYDREGLLQPVKDLAWRIRISDDECTEALQALSAIGVTRETADGWTLINFAKRQDREVSDSAIRMRRLRERKRENSSVTGDVTSDVSPSVSVSSSVSDSDSLNLNDQKPKTRLLTEGDIGRVYAETTGMVSMPACDKRGDYIDAIYQMLLSYGYDATLARMQSAYNAWKKQHTKDGRQYSKTNIAWINYAVAGEVPGGNGSITKSKSVAEEIAEELSHDRQSNRR